MQDNTIISKKQLTVLWCGCGISCNKEQFFQKYFLSDVIPLHNPLNTSLGRRSTMAMGRGIRVFHNPNQTPYSVLIEQRGVDHLILLESQAIMTLSK